MAPLNNKSGKYKRDYENIYTGNTLQWEYRKLEGNRLSEHDVAWWESSVICVDLCPRGPSGSIAMQMSLGRQKPAVSTGEKMTLRILDLFKAQ